MTRYDSSTINGTRDTVRSHYTWGTQDRFEIMRAKCMRPRPVLRVIEAETKTNYCETETETETNKVVLRPRWSRDLNISGKLWHLYTMSESQKTPQR